MEKLYLTFYIKKDKENLTGESPIFVKITLGDKKTTMATGLKIETKRWKITKQLRIARTPSDVDKRNQLSKKREHLEKIVVGLRSRNLTISPESIKKRLSNSGPDEHHYEMALLELYDWHNQNYEERVKLGEVTSVSLQKHKNIRSKINEFIQLKYGKKDLALSDLNYSFIADFDLHLRLKYKMGHNTVVKMTQGLKKIIREAIKRDWLSKDPFVDYSQKEKEVETIFLTQEELDVLENKDLRNNSLDVARDHFLFTCYTGYAPCDVSSLTMENVVQSFDGEKWVLRARQKTKTNANIPLLPKPLDIIEKYKDYPDRLIDGLLLPKRSNQRVNAYLKEIAALCGIKKNLTHYVGRHTFATTVALANGISMESLSKMLGHKRITQTQHYGKIQDLRVSEEMKALRIRMLAKSGFQEDL